MVPFGAAPGGSAVGFSPRFSVRLRGGGGWGSKTVNIRNNSDFTGRKNGPPSPRFFNFSLGRDVFLSRDFRPSDGFNQERTRGNIVYGIRNKRCFFFIFFFSRKKERFCAPSNALSIPRVRQYPPLILLYIITIYTACTHLIISFDFSLVSRRRCE